MTMLHSVVHRKHNFPKILTVFSAAISNVRIAEFEDGGSDVDLEIHITYGIVGIALGASSILFVVYVINRLLKKMVSSRSSESDRGSIDSCVIVCNEIPDTHSREKAGTSFGRDDALVSTPHSQRTSTRMDEPVATEAGL
ncbi:uncharacterized protein LOC119181794 [Rhipicephalus microplus]|uniref:uncharacterized protein LOC119181794 n=1 Tax=Rhipicephalus microplus TaxID=6941 RepID=UPI003F6B9002